MDLLHQAIHLMESEFSGKKDLGGMPYSYHCITVMNGVRHLGNAAMAIGVLHDLYEDIPGWNSERLVAIGYSTDVADRITILTKKLEEKTSEEKYFEYIQRVSSDTITRAVKLADLRHNMDMTRLQSITGRDLRRLTKYHTAYQTLIHHE